MPFSDYFRTPEVSNDEKVESHSIERIPNDKRWPILAINLVLLGNASAMFFFTIGAKLSFYVGWPTFLLPIAYFFFGSLFIGALVMLMASKEGLSQALISRGLGFGSRGAAITSFIYGVNFVFYFIAEGTFVAHACAYYFGIDVNSVTGTVIFAIVGFITVGLVWRGMYAMSVLQKWGYPIFLIFLAWSLVSLNTNYDVASAPEWTSIGNSKAALWEALSFANGQMIFQSLMATDYGRFARPRIGYRGTLLIMILELIPMFMFIFVGAYFGQTLVSSMGEGQAQDPGLVFVHVLGLAGVVFVIITQIRINVMNFYGGSLALASGFDTALNFRPGRPWWMVVILIGGIICYSVNVINYIPTFLAITGVLTNTWVLIILSDYWICRRLLKLGDTQEIEYRNERVRGWNPCGLVSLGVAVFVGGIGIAGIYPVYYASFIAMILGPILHVGITTLSGGKFYVPSKVTN